MTTTITSIPEPTSGTDTPRPRLSEAQQAVLGAAAQRGDDLALPVPESVPLAGAALTRFLASLLKRGLVEELAAAPGQAPWRKDRIGDPRTLRITPAGLAAIGLERLGEEATAKEPGASDEASEAALADPNVGATIEPVDGQASWPRPGTKQAVLVELLRRPGGATLAELQAATGWLPHTTRAALTGLRKGGLAIRRVRAASGGTSYRLGAAAAEQEAQPATAPITAAGEG